MSKLDSILFNGLEPEESTKQQIKELILGIIGINSSLDDNAVLKYKKELRQKVNEL